jgi:hypothetical protein
LQHGKPEERSSIVKKLSGQVVILSKQKFASNVIEKCLTFGTPEERNGLIGEIISSGQIFQVCFFFVALRWSSQYSIQTQFYLKTIQIVHHMTSI